MKKTIKKVETIKPKRKYTKKAKLPETTPYNEFDDVVSQGKHPLRVTVDFIKIPFVSIGDLFKKIFKRDVS